MWNRFVLLFFAFGCWAKYLDYPLGYVTHSIWYVIAFVWIVLNILGILAFVLTNKKPKDYELPQIIKDRWVGYYLLCATSFFACGEQTVCIAFILTAVVFMFLVLFATTKKPTKNKR